MNLESAPVLPQLRPAPEPILVRPLLATDRDPLAQLLAVDSPFDLEERAVALELIDAAIADVPRGSLDPALSGYEIRVGIWDGAVAGYVCFGPTPMTQGTYDLYWVVTGAAQRGRGIARTLVREMERELRQRAARLVRVETSRLEAYGAARAFYARLGYPVAAELRDFYRPGDDLIIYLQPL